MSFIQYHSTLAGVALTTNNQRVSVHYKKSALFATKTAPLAADDVTGYPRMFLWVSEKRLFQVLFIINGWIVNKPQNNAGGFVWWCLIAVAFDQGWFWYTLGMIWSLHYSTSNSQKIRITYNINGNKYVYNCKKKKIALFPCTLWCQSMWLATSPVVGLYCTSVVVKEYFLFIYWVLSHLIRHFSPLIPSQDPKPLSEAAKWSAKLLNSHWLQGLDCVQLCKY